MSDILPEFEIKSVAGEPVDIRDITGSIPSSAVPGATAPGKTLMVAGKYTTAGTVLPILVDDQGRIVTSEGVISSYPAANIINQNSINASKTIYTLYTASQKLAIKEFYAGGTGIGKQSLYKYVASTNQFINAGDFELTTDFGISTDLDKWFWTSVAGTGSIARSNVQKFTGSFSAQLTFTNSSGNNAQDVKQNFSTPKDFSTWRYLSAQFYNTVSAGGAYTRTISIIITDSNGSTRTYSVSGSSTSAPFNTAGWIEILGEIENPTSVTGTSFDITLVTSITLRMSDSANKSGTVYWDTVRLSGALSISFPIYHAANVSFNLLIDPVIVLNIGESVLIAQQNNDTARKEYFAAAAGVLL